MFRSKADFLVCVLVILGILNLILCGLYTYMYDMSGIWSSGTYAIFHLYLAYWLGGNVRFLRREMD